MHNEGVKRYGWIVLLLLVIARLVVGRKYLGDLATDIVTPDIKVVSDSSLLAVGTVDRDKIRDELNTINLYDARGVTYYAPTTAQQGSVSVRKIKIVLTPTKQPLGLTYYQGEREPFQSWGVEYAPTASGAKHDLTIWLYVREDIVQRETGEPLAKWYQGVLLNALWDLTHPQKAEYTGMERFAGMSEYIQSGVGASWWSIDKAGGRP